MPFRHNDGVHPDVDGPEHNLIIPNKGLWIGSAPIRMSIEEQHMYIEYEIENLITDVWTSNNHLRIKK